MMITIVMCLIEENRWECSSCYVSFFLFFLIDQVAYREPLILTPTNKEQLADEGKKAFLNDTMVLSQHYKYYKSCLQLYFIVIISELVLLFREISVYS